VVIQGLVILFCGALSLMIKPTIEKLFMKFFAAKESANV